jgi:hypothetical protein
LDTRRIIKFSYLVNQVVKRECQTGRLSVGSGGWGGGASGGGGDEAPGGWDGSRATRVRRATCCTGGRERERERERASEREEGLGEGAGGEEEPEKNSVLPPPLSFSTRPECLTSLSLGSVGWSVFVFMVSPTIGSDTRDTPPTPPLPPLPTPQSDNRPPQ